MPAAPGSSPALANWSDNFDSYATDLSLHGVGGWKGWGNDSAATAYTRDTQARSTPNSVEIVGASDLVHEYTGYTSGLLALYRLAVHPDRLYRRVVLYPAEPVRRRRHHPQLVHPGEL